MIQYSSQKLIRLFPKLGTMIYLSDCEYEQTLLRSLVKEAVEAVRQSVWTELEFAIFLVLDGREDRFVMELV